MAVNTVKVNINGQNYDLTYNSSSGKWEGTITAPNTTSWNELNNKYGVIVTATDDAGNATVKDRTDATLGSALQLRVLEKVKPTVSLSSPSSGARVITSRPAITFALRDTGSGVKISSLQLKIDGGATIGNTAPGMVVNSVSGGFDCVYTPPASLSEGAHTVTISVEDNDGNVSTLLSSAFTVDTVPPALNITSPANSLVTNNKNLTVTGTTNDATSSPVVVTIKLNGVDQGAVTVSSGSFSKAIVLAEGSNTIEIKATDSAGLVSTVTRTITVDTVAPNITAVTVTPNPVDSGQTFIITVTVTD